MNPLLENFKSALEHSFIDQSKETNELYKAKLLVNPDEMGRMVLNDLVDELATCTEFFFAVAFITESGLLAIKTVLSDLAKKNIRGRIITSNYLYFNSPKMFKELLKLKNVDVRITEMDGFHAKGYSFKHDDYETMILGSSNLTIKALKVNCEWNLKLNSLSNGDLIQAMKQNFEHMWEESEPLSNSWITKYQMGYKPILNVQKVDTMEEPSTQIDPKSIVDEVEYATKQITPNDMQKKALIEIQKMRDLEKTKAMVVSATGTGKTYLSAFDVKVYQPEKFLFIVHQEQILKKAKDQFIKILGEDEEKFGILSGNSKVTDEKYVFATIQTLSKDETLQKFAKDTFDYILIDEVHHAGAKTYQKVIDYFEPNFLLGMTATPERTDGYNIYEMFDYNVAYEIRLQEALKENMLCPFHYFGITDIQVDGKTIDDKSSFNQLVSDKRINYIIEKIDYYGHCGDKVRGLIFCGTKKEAHELEQKFNNRGFHTKALTGDHKIDERDRVIAQLEAGKLDYIITVDIFNEGIDIPSVNQVVMLRKTESSIIFTQQLGRGLRKAKNKDFVTIIDFIGNYDNNYLIPIALTEDNSLNKNNLRKKTMATKYLQGMSTIMFDEITKNRIFQSIESSKLNNAKNYREAYQNLKNRLGRMPKLVDFIEQQSVDPVIITKYKENYPAFLNWLNEETPALNSQETKVLTFLSNELLNGKRNHELLLLVMLIDKKKVSAENYQSYLKEQGYICDEQTIKSVERILSLDFFTQNEREKYGNTPIAIYSNGTFSLKESFQQSLQQNQWFTECVEDIIKTSFESSKRYVLSEPLTYNEVYGRKDVCRLLNWENNETGTMYGYRIKYNTCPIFVNYHKDDKISNDVKYEDELIDQHTLLWYTRPKLNFSSKEVLEIMNYKKTNLAIHVFVQKESVGDPEFIYLGRAFPKLETAKELIKQDKNGKDTNIVSMEMTLEKAVPLETYDFIKQK
ncbi:DUF3427 domain-containing protein [Enterococcus plantarum]|uniref:DUF3427 domain-containing protein n=1 Tax=Enterococcus plantarum TaxID=1077675 RepID=A0A2W4A407_9ENTE|nr:DEAD/DEAH box helicase [Enterococcus plantarum]PZL75683.1 DUF3427 domain-containing protein [Enterococcus plantarum]